MSKSVVSEKLLYDARVASRSRESVGFTGFRVQERRTLASSTHAPMQVLGVKGGKKEMKKERETGNEEKERERESRMRGHNGYNPY